MEFGLIKGAPDVSMGNNMDQSHKLDLMKWLLVGLNWNGNLCDDQTLLVIT
jgi:hypothetical protein